MEEVELKEFREVFVAEAKEYLSTINSSLLGLEKNPEDMNLIKEIFRVSHTLKGMAATMEFDKITKLTHKMEDILDKIKNGKVKPENKIVDILFDCLDILEVLIEEIVTGVEKKIEINYLIEQIEEITKSGDIQVTENISKIQKPDNITLMNQPAENKSSADIQKQVNDIDLSNKTNKKSESVRIKIELLDKLLNLVGELIISKARINQLANSFGNSDLVSSMAQFDRISSDIQEEVLKLRMVPVKHIFDRYPRMIRDLTHRLNKEIEFVVLGSEIEIDRTLLEEINEPLVHILRNAVDHGIETSEERKKNNKPDAGTVKLIAKREKGYCSIEVSDDGKGLDKEKIINKAIEKGIIKEQETMGLSDNDVFMLICNPNFSTAEQITDISGRGVGMDVVKSMVSNVGGKLEIKSIRNQGTTFIMRLPMSLAIIQVILVKIKNVIYAVPLSNVNELTEINQDEIKTIDKKEVFLLRNEIIPIKRLDKLFDFMETDFKIIPEIDKTKKILITEIENKKIGFLVDKFEGQMEIVIKTLPNITKNNKYFSGATILGDGRVVLILDVLSIY